MTSTDSREQMNKASDEGWQALADEDFALAREKYSEAAAVAVSLGDKIAEAVFKSYLASAHKECGEAKRARELLNESLALAENEGDSRVIGHVCYFIAELDEAEGDESAAISALWRALDSSLEANDSATAEVSLAKLGEIYRNRGWLEQAAECFRQAYELLPEGDNSLAWLGNLAQTLAEMGDLRGALPRFKQALELAISRDDLKAQSRCLASEGLAHLEEGQTEQALKCLEEALELSRRTKDRRAESCWLGNLGNVYLRLGRIEEATSFCSQALDIARQEGDSRSAAAHLDSIGDCLSQEGEHEKALEHYKMALAESMKICDRLGERVYRANQGKALMELGRTDDALEELSAAASLFEEQRARIQSDIKKTSFVAAGQHIYRDAISLCIKSGKRIEALEFVGRAKSRAMLDLLANSPIDIADLQNVDDKSISRLIERELELRGQIAALERMFGQTDGDLGHRSAVATQEDVPKLYQEWHDVVDQLRRRHPSYASMVSVDTLSFSGLAELWSTERPLLKDNDAIIEFFWAEEYFLSAAVWKGVAQPLTSILPFSELGELESDLYDFLEMSATEGWDVPVSLCKRLYDKLLSDVIATLPENIEHLILVPHGMLHKLPFAALNDGQTYLIEKYALSVLPSASLIKLLGDKRSGVLSAESDRYLVSAISDYSATRNEGIQFSARLRSSAGLEDLGYTLEEGKTVYSLASSMGTQAKFLTNDEVKDGLLEQFRDFSVIHFAGHAVFNPEEPLASGLVLADGSVLTAARILQDSSFRTEKGKLLVLSACQTGVNVITSGGEIVGLARALFYAGMPNLISSLWEVADRSTAQLMQDFHQIWQAGKSSIAGSLREAQLKALRESQPIHAWAPFIHLGID